MKRSSHVNSKIKLGIPNKNAKTITVKGNDYTLPTLTLYHRKFMKEVSDSDSIYKTVVPVIKKIMKIKDEDNLSAEIFEFLVIKLFEHNNIMNKLAIVGNEKFHLDDLTLNGQFEFVVGGVEYKFREPNIGEVFESYISGLNFIHGDPNIDFGDMGVEFFSIARRVFSTVKIVGDLGGVMVGIDSIFDAFVNKEVFDKIGVGNVPR